MTTPVAIRNITATDPPRRRRASTPPPALEPPECWCCRRPIAVISLPKCQWYTYTIISAGTSIAHERAIVFCPTCVEAHCRPTATTSWKGRSWPSSGVGCRVGC
ncbi:MAG: hypothetical protein V3S68_09805 [Dehalococcoidia bacterium]